jgi:peptide/nickel transport system substrate-binding protein
VALALVGLALLFRGSPAPDTGRQAAASADVRFGGQIVGSIRAEPRSFNRLVVQDEPSDILSMLMQGRLVRINRSTFELEPWLAERWETSADGRTHTMHLRDGATWSDGTPFTSADVVFSIEAALDPASESVVRDNLLIDGKPIRATAPDAATVVLEYPVPSGPGLRLLDIVTILPKHKLAGALASGTFASAWGTSTPPADIVGTGPFVLREYLPGQRVVLERNPRYWRRAEDGQPLPYLDRIVLELVPDQNAEVLRLQSGALDFTHGELRPEDYVAVRRAEEAGTLTLVELGVSTSPDAFWFCLKPEAKRADPRFAFVQRRELRQAISHAVDREEFAQTVFLGEAVPIWGPITPGNRAWFTPNVTRYPHDDARARALLESIGLEDRDGNGVVEDAAGTEARFTVLAQRGLGYIERGTTVLREELAGVGIALDVALLDTTAVIERLLACNYDAIYFRVSATDIDPAGNLDMWLSSGAGHFWNMAQKTPATPWERQIDELMTQQASTIDPERRREIFNEVQRVFAENLPVLYFAAPRMYSAHSRRLVGVRPSVLRPPILWNADLLSVADGD